MHRYRLLDASETLALARTIQRFRNRDQLHYLRAKKAVNRLVEANLRLVPKIWGQQFKQWIPSGDARLLDILQEGVIGLHRAAQLFDPCRGYTFATYAVFWIRKGFYDFLKNQNRNIRLPAHNWNALKDLSEKYDQAISSGRVLSEGEVADISRRHGMKPNSLLTALKNERLTTTISLDISLVKVQGDRTLWETVAAPVEDPEDIQRAKTAMRLFDLIACKAQLDPEERLLVTCHADGLNYEDLERLYPKLKHVEKRIKAARRRMRKVATEIGSLANLSVT